MPSIPIELREDADVADGGEFPEDACRWAITMRDAADEIERLRGTLVVIAALSGQTLISATYTDCDSFYSPFYSRGANAAFAQAAELAQTALDFKPSI